MKDVRNLFSALAWFCGLIVLQVILHVLGSAFPLPGVSLHGLHDWLTTSDTPVVVLTVVRVGAMAAIWYVLATTILCAIAHRSPWKRFATAVDRITLPGARVLAVRLATVSAIGGLAMPVASATAASPHQTPVLHHLTANEPTTSTTVTLPPVSIPQEPQSADAATSIKQLPQQHTVQRGENFWTIAQDTLTQSLNRQPTDDEITDYWRELVQVNKTKLAHPNNPDLLFAGQVLELPKIA